MAGELELGATSVGALVGRLEQRGLVECCLGEIDRRVKVLELTPEANVLMRKLDNNGQTVGTLIIGGPFRH